MFHIFWVRKKEMTGNFINLLWNRKFHMLELGFKERKNLKIQLKSLETHRLRIWTLLASEFLEVLNQRKYLFTSFFHLFLFFSYTEKIPYIINKAQSLGASDQEIKNRLADKQVTSTEKYGNRDRVGMLISMAKQDPLKQRLLLDKDAYIRRV